MTPESWQKVKELFEAALDRGPTERAAFLTQTCAGDPEIKMEVESLLAAHEADSGFMNTPVGNLLVSNKPMLTEGDHFGPYEEISLLGEGGMGQVFLAVDTRLGRKVALKLLPSSYTGEPERVRRFEQEARAASALNHPNIVTIHEIGQTDSIHFIATEFVDGRTLREHMKNVRMTLSEVLDIAAQIASALQAAHEAGIVHRDIKPENIMLRRDGFVKVLDFGLAKLAERERWDKETWRRRDGFEIPVPPPFHPPVSVSTRTDPGVVMGTAAYMSPEQARGAEVDARTDVWSLGVVLYELVAGRAPFEGETAGQVVLSILEKKPQPLSSEVEVPAELKQIISKAISKNKRDRYQTANEMAFEIKNLLEALTLEARLKRDSHPNVNGDGFATGRARLGIVRTIRESASRTRHGISARPTTSVEYLVAKIRHHKTYAAATLLIFLVGAIGLTYFAINRNKTLSAGGKKSIAVLPVKPISAARGDQIYEIGIADSLIHRLSSMKGIIVRPLSATRKYADISQDPLAAGREQQVDYVLASNYQLAEGKIRITAQLFNIANGQIEETYQSGERDSSNVFAMQDAIGDEIGKRLLAWFNTTSTGLSAKRETTNQEAYLLYLQGKNLMGQRSLKAMTKAVEYFEQAVLLDPNYARAYAGLAHASVNAGAMRGGLTRANSEQIKGMINKALELDNNLAEAYAARADLTLKYEWDFPAVEKDLLRAIELEPNNDLAHWLYALLSAYRGNLDKAMEEIETAQAVDPSALMYKRDRGRILYYARRYDEAIVQLQRVIELDDNFGTAYGWLWGAYEMKGDYDTAYQSLFKFLRRTDPDRADALEKIYKTAGWQGVKREQLRFFQDNKQQFGSVFFDSAVLCVQLGEKDQALEYLNKAIEKREWAVIMLKVVPNMDPLRGDPRFDELVRRLGL